MQIFFWVILGTILGAAIGYFTAAFFLAVSHSRIERRTWSQARLFYERKRNE
jgi:hypothetical protein